MGDSAVDAAIESPITDYLPVFSPSHSMPRHLLVQLMQIDEDRHIPRLAREHLLQSPPKECEEAFDPGVMMTVTQRAPVFTRPGKPIQFEETAIDLFVSIFFILSHAASFIGNLTFCLHPRPHFHNIWVTGLGINSNCETNSRLPHA